MIENRGLHDTFTKFFEIPSLDSFKDLMRKNFGEADQLDFKSEWLDWSKVAKHICKLRFFTDLCLVSHSPERFLNSFLSFGTPAPWLNTPRSTLASRRDYFTSSEGRNWLEMDVKPGKDSGEGGDTIQ